MPPDLDKLSVFRGSIGLALKRCEKLPGCTFVSRQYGKAVPEFELYGGEAKFIGGRPGPTVHLMVPRACPPDSGRETWFFWRPEPGKDKAIRIELVEMTEKQWRLSWSDAYRLVRMKGGRLLTTEEAKKVLLLKRFPNGLTTSTAKFASNMWVATLGGGTNASQGANSSAAINRSTIAPTAPTAHQHRVNALLLAKQTMVPTMLQQSQSLLMERAA